MKKEKNKVADNPYAKAGGGFSYEHKVQAYLTVSMLTNIPFHFPSSWRIEEIQFQTEWRGYETDDLAVIFANPDSDDAEKRKALVEIKSSISCTKSNPDFVSVIQNAWDDFDNSKIFEKEKDVIVLITGLLNAGDHKSFVRFIGNVKYTKSYEEFCEKKKSFSQKFKEKHEAIEKIIIDLIESGGKNNGGKKPKKPLSKKAKKSLDKKIYDFYRHFFVHQLDFGDDKGSAPVECFLMRIISDYQPEEPQQLWASVIVEMQKWNKSSGTFAKSTGAITHGSLPDNIRMAFSQKVLFESSLVSYVDAQINKLEAEDFNFLSRAVLLGAWNDQNENDQAIVSQLLQLDGGYADCKRQAQKILGALHQKAKKGPRGLNPILMNRGNIWRVENRSQIWEIVGSHIRDSDIEIFKNCAIKALKEIPPDSDFTSERRDAVNYSQALRRGLAEGLAILGSASDVLEGCSPNLGKRTSEKVVQKVLEKADASLWSSLNDLLPVLAEASPRVFLSKVEDALNQDSRPFEKLLEEEECIFFDHSMKGVISAMECLAWDKRYLVRVCVALGKMTNCRADGQLDNRPLGSLVHILMPWLPQTEAPQKKRETAAKAILSDFPDIALKLFPLLIPGSHSVVMDTYKPKWRNAVPENRNLEKKIFLKDYREELSFYSDLIIEAVRSDVSRFSAVVHNLSRMPEEKFNQLVESIDISPVLRLSEKKRFPYWGELLKFKSALQHNKEKFSLVEGVAKKLAPKSDFYICRWLFGYNDRRVVDGIEDAKNQDEKLVEWRNVAIAKLLGKGGVKQVIRLIKEPDVHSYEVGRALGSIDNKNIDQKIFPDFLENSDEDLDLLARGVINKKIKDLSFGWKWFKRVYKSKPEWTPAKIGRFLAYFPLDQKTWKQSSKLLGENDKEYWSRVDIKANIFDRRGEKNISHAVDMLIQHGNLPAAIELLYAISNKDKRNARQCVRALLSLSDKDIGYGDRFKHDVITLIRFLQSANSLVNKEDMIKVEWAFIEVPGVSRKFLEREMSSNSDFFCKKAHCASLIGKDEKEHGYHGSESSKSCKLLEEWETIPGMGELDDMDAQAFSKWFRGVKKRCEGEAYWKSILERIGAVLSRAPAEPDKLLWINRDVAAILSKNSDDAAHMRDGFFSGKIYSRSAYVVDKTGEQERKLEEKYRAQADQVENHGFHLLAETVRDVADYYAEERRRAMAPEDQEN